MAPKPPCMRCPQDEIDLLNHGDDLSKCQKQVQPDGKRYTFESLWPDFTGEKSKDFKDTDDAQAFIISLRDPTKEQRAHWSKLTVEEAAKIGFPLNNAKKNKKKTVLTVPAKSIATEAPARSSYQHSEPPPPPPPRNDGNTCGRQLAGKEGSNATDALGTQETSKAHNKSRVCEPAELICPKEQSHRKQVRPIVEMPVSIVHPIIKTSVPDPQLLNQLSGHLDYPRFYKNHLQHIADAVQYDPDQYKGPTSASKKTQLEYQTLRAQFATTNSQRIELSNHFKMTIPPGLVLYEYRIAGFPDKIFRVKRRKVVPSVPLHIEHTWDKVNKELKIYVPNYRPGTRDDPEGVPMTMTLVAEHILDGLKAYVSGPNESYKDVGAIEALNIVIAKALSGNNPDTFQSGPNRFYYRPGWKALPSTEPSTTGLISMRGYVAKAKPGMGSVLLNINTINSVFYRSALLSQYLDYFQGLSIESAQAHLNGLRLFVNFSRSEANDDDSIDNVDRRIKTLAGFGKLSNHQYVDINGAMVTVAAHLQQKYSIQHDDEGLGYWAANVGSKAKDGPKKFYLANQLVVVSDQKYSKTPLPADIISGMIDFARRTLKQNYGAILGEGMSSLGLQNQLPPILKALGIGINPEMVSIPARLIPGPQIHYAKGVMETNNNGFFAPGLARLKNTTQKLSGPQNDVAVVQFIRMSKDGLQSRYEKAYANLFTSILPQHGIQRMKPLDDKRILEQAGSWDVDYLYQYLANFQKRGGNLAVFIFADASAESRARHAMIRIVVDQRLGLKAICMNEKSMLGSVPRRMNFRSGQSELQRDMMTDYMRNIAMKLNLRCGNYNHTLNKQNLPRLDDRTIILGADVTHPGSGSLHGTPSIAAVVGSDDASFARFPRSMRLNPSRQESIDQMKYMVYERLLHWHNKNGKVPTKVLFYRDGVSDSQFAKVRYAEINAIRLAYTHLCEQKRPIPAGTSSQPSITTVVVTKRHDTRLYPRLNATGNELSRSENCPPGTVVDSGITSPYYFDFFLLSHNVMKGTAKPAHYFVPENEMNFTPKELQDLTFNLCHTYGTSTSAVSYAPPAYYADKLCERGRLYLKPFFDNAKKIREKMHADKMTDEKANDYVMEEAKKVFYKYSAGTNNNPWHQSNEGKMFWM